MLDVQNLWAEVDGQTILRGIDLSVKKGEVHAIMGPNGSGKSTLTQVLSGRETYEVTDGTVTFKGKDLLELEPEDRAREGIFMAFQYPVEIPGVSCTYFLKTALNAIKMPSRSAAGAKGTMQKYPGLRLRPDRQSRGSIRV